MDLSVSLCGLLSSAQYIYIYIYNYSFYLILKISQYAS